MPSAPSVLERRLGPYDAAAIIVSNVIGGGILFLSRHRGERPRSRMVPGHLQPN